MPIHLAAAAALILTLAVVGHRFFVRAVRNAATDAWMEIRRSPFHIVALASLSAVGVVVRLKFVRGPMRWDESYTYLAYASLPLKTAVSFYDAANNHVLNTILIHGSCQLLSSLAVCGPLAIRAPVFAAGVLLAPAGYVAGTEAAGRHVGLLLAALAATSPQLVEYATNARGYELAALATFLVLATGLRALRTREVTWWAVFAVIAALGLYAVPVFAYPFGVIVLAFAGAGWTRLRRGSRRAYAFTLGSAVCGALALTALLYGPILGAVIRLARNGEYARHQFALLKQTWQLWMIGLPRGVVWLLVIAFIASALALRRRASAPVAIAFVAIAVAAVAVHHVVGYTRVWVPVLPLFLFAVAEGMLGWGPVRRALDRRGVTAAFCGVVVLAAIAFGWRVVHQRLANTDGSALPAADAIAATIGPRMTAGDHLLVSVAAWPIQAYAFQRAGLSRYEVYGRLAPSQGASGTTYLVVDTTAGETFQSAFAATAPGWPATAHHLVEHFRGAAVYRLSPGTPAK